MYITIVLQQENKHNLIENQSDPKIKLSIVATLMPKSSVKDSKKKGVNIVRVGHQNMFLQNTLKGMSSLFISS